MFSRIVRGVYYLFGANSSYDEPDIHRENLVGTALRRCNVELRNKLNLTEIIPHLNQHDLVTNSDVHMLRSMPAPEGVDHLISMLPRKKDGWWKAFIAALKGSSSGTAHNDLVTILETELQQLMSSNENENIVNIADNQLQQNGASEYHPRSSQVEVVGGLNEALSGITRAMSALMVNPFLFSNNSANDDHIVDPNKPLKDELEEVKRK